MPKLKDKFLREKKDKSDGQREIEVQKTGASPPASPGIEQPEKAEKKSGLRRPREREERKIDAALQLTGRRKARLKLKWRSYNAEGKKRRYFKTQA